MSAGDFNRAWGRALVKTLREAGTGCFFLSPGARSSALVAAVAELPPGEAVVHYDERGTAFAALGWAKANGRPAVVITTSGSAVVNLHPALIEASYGEVPLIFLTADRPPELHGTGANQTIRQEDLFAGDVRARLLLPCPEDLESFGSTLRMVHETVRTACQFPQGPVFINAPFREPLLPVVDLGKWDSYEPPAIPDRPAVEWSIPSGFFQKNGAILMGALPAADQAGLGAVIELGRKLGWPVIADALSGGKGLPGTVCHADLLLLREDAPAPECVLHFGGAMVSKRVAQWQSRCRSSSCVQVRQSPRILDPWAQNPTHLQISLEEFLSRIEVPARQPSHNWDAADSMVDAFLNEELQELSEPSIARCVSAVETDLFLGNSMPVRDFDAFAERPDGVAQRRVFGNRGASGIDGNVATMAGIARSTRRPLTGLMGDIALLHDLNSLALLRDLPVTLVVVNNDGGGIFQFLPLWIGPADRRRFWETPHGMHFQGAADQFNLQYRRIESLNELKDSLMTSSERGRILECQTSRDANFMLHRSLATQVQTLPILWKI